MLHEPTTSITDFLLGVEALLFAALLTGGKSHAAGLPYWTMTLVLLGVAALLGGFAHGLARRSLFIAIYLCLAALMVTFVLATLSDSFGLNVASKVRWIVILTALVFVLVAWHYPTRILTFAVIEGIILVLALILYLRLAVTQTLPGAGYLAAGIATTLLAVAFLLKNVQFTLICTFDRNGVYHLVQMAGILFFYIGLSLRGSAT